MKSSSGLGFSNVFASLRNKGY